MINKIQIFIIFYVILNFIFCSRKTDETIEKFVPNDNYQATINKIEAASFMEDILHYDTLKIKVPNQFNMSSIIGVNILSNKNLIIIGRYSEDVLLFDSKGFFIRNIGGKGQGPGEYISPEYIANDQNGDILIGDAARFNISFHDKNGTYLNSFKIKNRIDGLLVSEQGNIILYDYYNALIRNNETIYVYDRDGRVITKFGRVSEAQKKLRKLPFDPPGPYIAIYKDYIFESDYADFQIRKYHLNGNFIKEFGIKPKCWVSALNTEYQKLPEPQMVTPNVLNKIQKFYKDEFFKSTIVYWLTVFEPGIITIMIKKAGTKFEECTYFTFYDFNGNRLNDCLTFRNFPIKPLTTIVAMSRGFCFVQYLNNEFELTDNSNEQQIKIIIANLK